MHQEVNIYMEYIVKLLGTLMSCSNKDPRYISRVWKEFQGAKGMKLKFSTTFHHQTDGHSERRTQVLKHLLRSCMLDWQNSWKDHLLLVEFAYNNSFLSTII